MFEDILYFVFATHIDELYKENWQNMLININFAIISPIFGE